MLRRCWQNHAPVARGPSRERTGRVNAETQQTNGRRDTGTDESGGAQRKMLRLAQAASPADGDGAGRRGSRRFELAWSLPNRGGGQVQVPGRAVFTCACSAPWGDGARGSAPGMWWKYPP